MISPGITGPVGFVTKRMSLYIAEELERSFGGEPLRKPVARDMLGHIA